MRLCAPGWTPLIYTRPWGYLGGRDQLPPYRWLVTSPAADRARGIPASHPALRNAASGRFSDGGLVAEVGAAAARLSRLHTVSLSAGSILQTRRGRPHLHLERKTGSANTDDGGGGAGVKSVAIARPGVGHLSSSPVPTLWLSSQLLHPHVLRCGRPPASGGWLGGCGHGAWSESTPRATAPAHTPGLRPRAPCEAPAF